MCVHRLENSCILKSCYKCWHRTIIKRIFYAVKGNFIKNVAETDGTIAKIILYTISSFWTINFIFMSNLLLYLFDLHCQNIYIYIIYIGRSLMDDSIWRTSDSINVVREIEQNKCKYVEKSKTLKMNIFLVFYL